MIRLTWIVPVAALAATGACSTYESVETRTYDLSGFDSISASSGVNVVLKQGPFAINAEGPKSRLDKLVIERDGSQLSISRKPSMNWFGWNMQSDIVTVSAPAYMAIAATGGADVDIGGLNGSALSISASGGADINASGVVVDTLTANVSGGGDLNLTGSCKSLTVEASGGADFGGENLRCDNAVVTASSGSDVDVIVSGSASGNGSSGADIRFHGNPASFQSNESSGADVSAGS